MNQPRFLTLTALLLMMASRLPGQLPAPQQGVPWDGQVVACNEGRITFSVGRAYRYSKPFLGYEWQFHGWDNVDPGKCAEIGPIQSYHNATFGKDSVTLLAFAFRDSTGTWGAVKLRPSDDRLWHPSNQQFCVRPEGFAYDRDSPEGDLPRGCDGAQAGYQMIPASFEYRGPLGAPTGYTGQRQDYLHVKLGPSDRAIPLGKRTSSGGAAPGPGTTEDLLAILKDTIRGPGAPRFRGSPAGSFVQVCVPSAVVEKQSWANPQSASAKALKDAIRQFTGSHNFVGGGQARLRVTETLDRFMVEEVKACSDDDDDFNMASP